MGWEKKFKGMQEVIAFKKEKKNRVCKLS